MCQPGHFVPGQVGLHLQRQACRLAGLEDYFFLSFICCARILINIRIRGHLGVLIKKYEDKFLMEECLSDLFESGVKDDKLALLNVNKNIRM